MFFACLQVQSLESFRVLEEMPACGMELSYRRKLNWLKLAEN